MRQRQSIQVRSQGALSPAEKAAITAACQRLIDEILKPRFLPAIRPTKFNYPVDICGKWHGSHADERRRLSGSGSCGALIHDRTLRPRERRAREEVDER